MEKFYTAPLLTLLALLVTELTASRCAQGFVARSQSTSLSCPSFVAFRGGKVGTGLLASESGTSLSIDDEVPSWESLESKLEKARSSHGQEKKPVLTLYRDTNGWCPFCERVWVAIRAKGLPYQETLVPLQGKPEWYKQMVPTGLVPAVLFHGDEESDESETINQEGGSNNKVSTSRELVWESDAILEALDAKFPDTPKLMKTGEKDFDEALDLHNRVQAAGFKFSYGNRNGTLTDEEIQKNREDFESLLDELDTALGAQASACGTEECFRLGTEFSGIDAIMIPTLERWRYQLPITENLDILENRRNLKNWFETMDSFEAYGDRVAGDEYSWTATASMFLRYFGGGEDKPKVAEGIARADAAAEKLAGEFVAATTASTPTQTAALEAAAKLISNHEAVVADCVREDPLSQQHIPRATPSGTDTVDYLLRQVSSMLLSMATESSQSPASASFLMPEHNAEQGALALQTISKRLCVPRDMGAPSAALLRGTLSLFADALAEKEANAAEAVVS